jgi:4,5:9,10-diseco-3-hydroxy-5,9,17-trioxoandrosta-1(10),2-diene-4-oate hydrolase
VRRESLGAAEPHPEATVAGVRLAYDDEGYGPPVVCLHAIGHGASDWTRLRERLRDRHRVLALDWPGHGRSGDDGERVSIARYAELLRLFLLAARVESAVLVGNSIGGGAALRFACENPHRVRGLVLANPAGLDERDRLSALAIGAMVGLFAAGTRSASWYAWAFAQYYRWVLPSEPARAQRDRIVIASTEMAPLLLQAWESFAAPDSDLRGLAPKVECPVLFTWATRDRFVQLPRNRAAIARFPRHQLRKFHAGHSPQLETPEEFADAVERFLAQSVPPPSTGVYG